MCSRSYDEGSQWVTREYGGEKPILFTDSMIEFDHLRNPNYSYITTLEEVPKPCDTNAVIATSSWTMGYSQVYEHLQGRFWKQVLFYQQLDKRNGWSMNHIAQDKKYPYIKIFCCLMLSLLSCSSYEEQVSSVVTTDESAVKEQEIHREYQAEKMIVLIDEPSILHQLEEQKYSLSQVLPLSSEQKLERNQDLWKSHSNYRLLMEHLGKRIDDIAQNKVKRPLERELRETLKYPAGNVGRYFDSRWLSSPSGFFQSDRIRQSFGQARFYSDGGCGDIRFVYRLAYKQDGDGLTSSFYDECRMETQRYEMF